VPVLGNRSLPLENTRQGAHRRHLHPRHRSAVEQVYVYLAVALLAYLALSPGSHSRDALAALLWPVLDGRRTLSLLNRTLGGVWFAIDRETAGWASGDGTWPAQSTPFVGRERQLVEIARLLADRGVRLLTVSLARSNG